MAQILPGCMILLVLLVLGPLLILIMGVHERDNKPEYVITTVSYTEDFHRKNIRVLRVDQKLKSEVRLRLLTVKLM